MADSNNQSVARQRCLGRPSIFKRYCSALSAFVACIGTVIFQQKHVPCFTPVGNRELIGRVGILLWMEENCSRNWPNRVAAADGAAFRHLHLPGLCMGATAEMFCCVASSRRLRFGGSQSWVTSTVSRPAIRRFPWACSRCQLMESGMTDVLGHGVLTTNPRLVIFGRAGRLQPVSRDPLRGAAPASPVRKFRVRLPNLLFPLSTKSFE